MKKEYESPKIDVVELKTEQVLDGSTPVAHNFDKYGFTSQTGENWYND